MGESAQSCTCMCRDISEHVAVFISSHITLKEFLSNLPENSLANRSLLKQVHVTASSISDEEMGHEKRVLYGLCYFLYYFSSTMF